ncbi:Hypothetical protein CINCED_3A013403 [Cinara cedri]|uniref:Uncharacterized protein n=1 Tax=Cinara cedri TaxID=506608 RepID=A0A5E4MNI0_9HEMI|nr:Hypothetical protein CINCED_3A013403 [Cinara cedri]
MDNQQQFPTNPSTGIQGISNFFEQEGMFQTEADMMENATAARVKQLSIQQLRRDPVLWSAYVRGWEDFRRTVQFQAPPMSDRRGGRPPTAPTGRGPRPRGSNFTGQPRQMANNPMTNMGPPQTTEWPGMQQPNAWCETYKPSQGIQQTKLFLRKTPPTASDPANAAAND